MRVTAQIYFEDGASSPSPSAEGEGRGEGAPRMRLLSPEGRGGKSDFAEQLKIRFNSKTFSAAFDPCPSFCS